MKENNNTKFYIQIQHSIVFPIRQKKAKENYVHIPWWEVLSIYHVPDSALGTWPLPVNKRDEDPCPSEA